MASQPPAEHDLRAIALVQKKCGESVFQMGDLYIYTCGDLKKHVSKAIINHPYFDCLYMFINCLDCLHQPLMAYYWAWVIIGYPGGFRH
jgi:hypothetical protein